MTRSGAAVALIGITLLSACSDGTTETPNDGAVAAWLTSHPRIADALVWDAGDGRGARSYATWSANDKAALERAVSDATNGTEASLADPPENLVANRLGNESAAATVLSDSDARGLYFAHVGRSIMLEMTRGVPWSIADYAAADLAILLDSRSFFLWRRNAAGTGISGYAVYDDTATSIAPNTSSAALGFVIPAPPKVTARFLSENSIIAGDRLTTIQRLLEWERANLGHFGGAFTLGNTFAHWQYRGAPPVSRMLTGTTISGGGFSAPPFGHWTAGCPGTNWFMMAVLRVINIPVRYVVVEEHAMPHFATENKYLSHGDDPYNRYWSPAIPTVPAAALLIEQGTFDTWFSPTIASDRRLANIGRQTKELGIKHLSNRVLHRRCDDMRNGITNRAASSVYADVQRIYTVGELEAMDLWNRLDAKIAELGGCSKLPSF